MKRSWLIALVLAIAAAAPAAAQRVEARASHVADAGERFARSQAVPMSQARRAVLQRYPGSEILDSWVRKDRNGQPVEYIIRIVTRDARRLDVRVDARSGRVIG